MQVRSRSNLLLLPQSMKSPNKAKVSPESREESQQSLLVVLKSKKSLKKMKFLKTLLQQQTRSIHTRVFVMLKVAIKSIKVNRRRVMVVNAAISRRLGTPNRRRATQYGKRVRFRNASARTTISIRCC